MLQFQLCSKWRQNEQNEMKSGCCCSWVKYLHLWHGSNEESKTSFQVQTNFHEWHQCATAQAIHTRAMTSTNDIASVDMKNSSTWEFCFWLKHSSKMKRNLQSKEITPAFLMAFCRAFIRGSLFCHNEGMARFYKVSTGG